MLIEIKSHLIVLQNMRQIDNELNSITSSLFSVVVIPCVVNESDKYEES